MALNKEQEECLDKVSVETRWRYGQPIIDNVFEDMPKEFVTEELCLAVAQKNGLMLRFVPEELKTGAVCRAAVESSGHLDNVPEALKTEELCLIAVRKKGGALSHVPKKLLTEALCIAAVKQDEQALEYVPKNLRAKVKAALKREL
jgi:hypothetical protein